MVKVELIAKQSVMADIRQSWINSGREDNAEHGVFIFENAEAAYMTGNGAVFYVRANDKEHYYNVADFYRISVTHFGE